MMNISQLLKLYTTTRVHPVKTTTTAGTAAGLEEKWERNSNLQFSKAPAERGLKLSSEEDPPLSHFLLIKHPES